MQTRGILPMCMSLLITGVLYSSPVLASRGQQISEHGTRFLLFNIICRYNGKFADGKIHQCQAGAAFQKRVSPEDAEVLDDSENLDNPRFMVECDDESVYNDGGRRFTDNDGTRIQAFAGPYPAITLPPESLRDQRLRVRSRLELRAVDLDGSCYIYTGTP